MGDPEHHDPGNKPGRTGLDRLWHATGYSLAGMQAAWRHEAAFRQEVVGCAVLVPLGLWLGDTGVERALLVATVLLVPLVELVNSALEAAVDRHGPERHPLAGRAKDAGSAAVLLALVVAGATWLLVLVGR
jgi:diacylglycerol kinase (ATP)